MAHPPVGDFNLGMSWTQARGRSRHGDIRAIHDSPSSLIAPAKRRSEIFFCARSVAHVRERHYKLRETPDQFG